MPNTNEQNEPHDDIINFLNGIGNVSADKVNPHFRSKYASLAEVLECVKAEAKKHRLAVHQTLSSADGQVRVTTTIIHKSGAQKDCGTLAIKSENLDAQKLGSAITYLRRQSIQAACGIAVDVDDDGERASDHSTHRAQQTKATKAESPYVKLISDPALAPKVKAYLVKRGWLSNDADVSELAKEHIDTINTHPEAFVRAVNNTADKNEQK